MADKVLNPTSDIIQCYGRMRFLRLEEPKAFQQGQDPRWEATQILDPSDARGAADIKIYLDTAANISKQTYGVVALALRKLRVKFIAGTPALDLNDPKNAEDGIMVPFSDGDAAKWEKYSGYAGMFIVTSHNKKKKPGVAKVNGTKAIPGEKGYPYDGCFGLLSSTIWGHATHGSYAKRIGVNLRGVQFIKDGPPFTQSEIDAEDEFTPLAEDKSSPAASNDGWD